MSELLQAPFSKLMIGLISENELASLLDVKPQTLQTWRMQKTGPDFVKLGKNVFYRKLDVETWVEANVVPTRRVMS
jgi:predicted DNA-binding transcriptional regulator AlpA